MTTIDIDALDFAELHKLRARVDERMKGLRDANVSQLRMRFVDEAADVGLTMDDVMGIERKKRGRKPNPPSTAAPDET